MWALVIFLYIQQGLDVQVVGVRIDGEPTLEAACQARTSFETKVLPLQPGDDARWQYATCVQVRS